MRTPATEECDLNYGNCSDMINASLTRTWRGKDRGNESDGLFENIIPNKAIA